MVQAVYGREDWQPSARLDVVLGPACIVCEGIAAKDLPYIFDRFYRTDVSRNSSKGGSGIGLSIVKKIMEDHGGKVWATSRLGIGTIMYFVLRKYQEVQLNE